MDRFIADAGEKIEYFRLYLKSNMDRFIVDKSSESDYIYT